MERNQAPINQLLAKYLRNECTPDEKLKLLAQLDNPENAGDIEAFMDHEVEELFQRNLTMDQDVSDRIFQKLKGSIDPTSFPQQRVSKPFYQSLIFRVAASLTGILLLAGLGYFLLTDIKSETYTTEEGQKSTITLSDGSRITLNDNSSVSFRMDDDSREVILNGEAYFDVTHDASRPFYVRTSDLEIKVLGTVFNVRSYHEDDRVETTLVSGKVVVKNLRNGVERPEEVELAPNEAVVYFKESAKLEKANTDIESQTAWRSGKLYFEDETASVIFSELEKWYSVKIAYDVKHGDCRFSMNIDQEQIGEVLGFFEKTTGIKVFKQGDGYRLEGKLCDRP